MNKLSDVLLPAGKAQRIDHPEHERFITVKLNCGGALQRQIKDGKRPVPFTGYRVSAGQFLYSRIDARNGAFAIVPPELDGAVVSKDFPVFSIDESKIHPKYLLHFFASGRPQQEIQRQSFGATNRQRVGEAQFLSLEIPLPPLEEQRRIVDILDRADALVAKRRKAIEHLDALGQSIFHAMFKETASTTLLGEVGNWQSGGTPKRSKAQYFGGGIPWITSGELGQTYIHGSEESLTELGVQQSAAKLFPAGSLLLGMYDTAALKSSVAAVEATCNQAIAFCTPEANLFEPLFLLYAVRNVRKRVLASRRGVRQKNLNLSMIKEIPVPSARLAQQRLFLEAVMLSEVQKEIRLRELGQIESFKRGLVDSYFGK